MKKWEKPEDIRVATIYYKPSRNQTARVPNYFIRESNEWIMFPHELEGLTLDEIQNTFGAELANLLSSHL